MSSIIKKTQRVLTSQGFTLVETLVYAAGLILLLGAILYLLSASYNWYSTATVGSRADQIGVALVDRIERDIRSGQNSNSSGSLFSTTTGALSINALVNSATIVKKYALTNGRITYQENSGSTQYVSPSDISVTRFYVTDIVNSVSEAIKFDIDITFSTKNGTTTTRTYSDVGIMRNSY